MYVCTKNIVMQVNSDDSKTRKCTDTLSLFMNHRIPEYLRIGITTNVSVNLQLLDYYLAYMKLDFHIALIILYVIDCAHSSEHDIDH